jgi:predicted transcriptional regulator
VVFNVVFVEAVVFLSAVVGIILAVGSFLFHAITRKTQIDDLDGKVEVIVDRAVDMALEEFNKTSQMVMDELNEKYKALLFVYQLMDDKQKELEGEKSENSVEGSGDKSAGGPVAKPPTSLDTAISMGFSLDIKVDDDLDVQELLLEPLEPLEPLESLEPVVDDSMPPVHIASLPEIPDRPAFVHPRYMEIIELLEQGMSVVDAARHLGVSKGEIQLIIGISGR